VRCSVFEKIGGWDENSLTEDVEYALRLVEQGGMLSMLLMCVQVRKHPQLYIV
jgi:GT2 family glycosyltransferase